ncbi:hypothetical protein ACTFIW_001284 [Dictyostelium discoideum]
MGFKVNKNINETNDNSDNDVAIIGIGFRLPSGNLNKSNDSPIILWDNLMKGFDGMVETSERWSDNFNQLGEISNKSGGLLPLNEWKSFDPLFFGINPSEAQTIDPQQRILLKCTWEAIEDSNIDPIKIRGSKTSVYMGGTSIEYKELNKNSNDINPNIFGSTFNTIANRISYCFDLSGESMTLDTACSSSLNAIILGYQSIKTGTSNLSIVGGVNLILDSNLSKSYSYLNMLSKKEGKCMSFDSRADGFVRSEGAGVFILKSLKQSIIDGNNIYCVIKGASSNIDGNGLNDKQNFYSPSSSSQAENINRALSSTKGSVKIDDIVYVEAHGTGTPTGDPIELEAISRVFKANNDNNNSQHHHNQSKNPILIGSFKSSVGHLESASGSASLVKCCLMFKNQYLTPNVNFKTPNPSIKFDEWNLKVVTEPIQFKDVKKSNNFSMILNNFGITGSNCCLILSQYNANHNDEKEYQEKQKPYLIPFSANSIQSLKQYESLINENQFKESNDFKEFVKHQIYSKSISLYQRSVLIASNWNDFNEGMKSTNSNNKIQTSNSKSSNISKIQKNPITVMVFAGQGSQYSTMAMELYNNEPIFKESMDRLDNRLSRYYGYSVLEKFRSCCDSDNIHYPTIAQPSMCMLTISLFELYKHWGIETSFIIGHSLGEIPAAYCSGMISLDTLCYLIYNRSVAQTRTHRNGRMLSINISPEEYNSNYSLKYPKVEIACYNSPTSIVLGGEETILNQISNDLKEKGIFSAMLGSLSSFHTSSQRIIKDQVIELNIDCKLAKIPSFSTVTTNLFNETTLFNSEYVFNNMAQPVKFSQSISNLFKHIEINNLGSDIVFIELAPHPTLQFYLKQMASSSYEKVNSNLKISTYSPLHKKKNDIEEIQKTISQLYCNNGYSINFKSQFNNDFKINKINSILPNYQWEDGIHWREDLIHQKHNTQGPPIDQLGLSLIESSPTLKSYQTFIDISRKPFQYLKGHFVNGKYYFPGCGYIDNLLKIYGSQNFTIASMEFKSPLIFTEGVNQCLQTNIFQTGKSEFKVNYHFKDTKSNEWIQSSVGHFQLFNNNNNSDDDGTIANKKYNIQDIINNKCNFTKLSNNELYENIKSKTGISYTGEFKTVSNLYVGENCSLAEIPITSKSSESSFFSPSILDTCLHGTIGLIDEKSQIVFERVEGFEYHSSNIPSQNELLSLKQTKIYSLTESFKRVGDSYSSSITVMLEDGRVLIEFKKVVCKSLTTVTDSLIIQSPLNELYSTYMQSINSPIQPPSSSSSSSLTQLLDNTNEKVKINYNQFISNQLYYNIIKRCPQLNIETIKSMNIEQLKENYNSSNINYSKLFKSVFETIQSIGINNEENSEFNETNIQHYKILLKSTRIIAKLLFPLKDDDLNNDTAQSLFENGILDEFNSNYFNNKNQVISNIIKESLLPILNEKIVFRIFGFGGFGSSLSSVVLNKINELLQEFPNSEIDIEFTHADISPSSSLSTPNSKPNFPQINEKVHIIYKSLDLEKQLSSEQMIKPSYYDFVIMSNVLHFTKDVKSVLDQIHQILKPNGQILLVEPIDKSILLDNIFGIFDQWWGSTDLNITRNDCYISKDTLNNLLLDCNFINSKVLISTKEISNFYIIQTQKPSISNLNTNSTTNDTVIIYGDEFKFISSDSNKVIKISNIQQFNELIEKSIITDESIIYFTKSINQLTVDNFKLVTLEYIQINQKLLSNNLKCKHVLITLNSDNINYLSASLIGASRYFEEFPQLNLFNLDFDQNSINNNELEKTIQLLLDSNQFIQKEFFIKNSKVYYERYKRELNLNNFFKESQSFSNEKNQLYAKLSPNLEYILKSKKVIKDDEIEVQVKATGINYKDYLIYCGLVSAESINRYGDINNPEFGIEYSGIISRVGNNITNFKIGDQVYGMGLDTISTTVVVDPNYCYHKPTNISFQEAASIPCVYLTSLCSIFNIGCFSVSGNESILIHSGTGGVGLSALNLLKWKGHKSHVFVTVGSKEKEKYLLDTYGDFITGIYSTRNKNYVEEIKLKLKQLGSNKNGVDLILNTLSSDYMESNFKCLNTSGRIVDLSVTHLNHNEYINNNNFKFNFGYHNFELTFINKFLIQKSLKKIKIGIESGELKLIPITGYSNSNAKEAIEFINQRKHIGKIVLNNDNDILDSLLNNLLNERNSKFTILKPNYQINKDHLGSNILVTGQSGIILEILKWIVKFSENVKNIIILSKSSMKWGLELLIKKNKHINFNFKSIDIGDSNQVDKAIDEILNENSITNIDSIFHFAFEHTICDVNDIEINHLTKSHGAKTMGAINLHNQSIKRNWKLKQFILSSSVTSMIGSTDQCTYVCSNRVLDSLSKYRNSIGLPSICTNYGSVQSAGIVSRNKSIEKLLDAQGLDPLSINMILGSLDSQIQNVNKSTNLMVSPFNFNNFFETFKNHSMIHKFDFITNLLENNKSKNSNNDNTKGESSIDTLFLNKVSELLSMELPKINQDLKLVEYGSDSLLIVQLKNWIDKEIFPNLITIQQLQTNTISSSIKIITNQFSSKSTNGRKKQNEINVSSNKSSLPTLEFWKNETKLDDNEFNFILDSSTKSKINHQNQLKDNEKRILLTGSTGFLGAYLLWHLIQMENCKIVYCLLRNKKLFNNPLNDIIDNLKHHQLYDKQLNESHLSKIVAVVGDLSKIKFGLSDDDYSLLSNDTNLLLNCGADINLSSNYEESKQVNVVGTKEMIKLSLIGNIKPKPIIAISSFSVFYNQKLNQEFDEAIVTPKLETINDLPAGYIQSKVISEIILTEASSRFNIPSAIIRAPSIFSNPDTGIGHSADIIQLMLQSCFKLGYYPSGKGVEFDLLCSPITWVADNTIKIIFNDNIINNKEPQQLSSPLKPNIYSVYGKVLDLFEILQVLKSDEGGNSKEIEINQWKQMVMDSKEKVCIKLRTFHTLQFDGRNILNKGHGISNKQKSYLQSIGSFGNGGEITNQMIFKNVQSNN